MDVKTNSGVAVPTTLGTCEGCSLLFLNIPYLTLYADDTQVYKSFDLDDCLSSILCVEKCVSDVKTWMTSNTLQMNEDKTDVLLVTAKQIVNLQHLPEFMNINGTCIKFSPSVRNLGVTLDSILFCISMS